MGLGDLWGTVRFGIFMMGKRGDYLVEFVLLLPVALVLIAAVYSIGRLLYIRESLDRTAYAVAMEAQAQAWRSRPPMTRWNRYRIMHIAHRNLKANPWTAQAEPLLACDDREGWITVCVKPDYPWPCLGAYIEVTVTWADRVEFVGLGSWPVRLQGRYIVPNPRCR